MPKRKQKGVEKAKGKAQTSGDGTKVRRNGAPEAITLPGLSKRKDDLLDVINAVTELTTATSFKSQVEVIRQAGEAATTAPLLRAWTRLLTIVILHDEAAPIKGVVNRAFEELLVKNRAMVEVVVSLEVTSLVSNLEPGTEPEDPEDRSVGALLLLWELPKSLIPIAARILGTVSHMSVVLRRFSLLLGDIRSTEEGTHSMAIEAQMATNLLKILVSVLTRVASRLSGLVEQDLEAGPGMLEAAREVEGLLHELLQGEG